MITFVGLSDFLFFFGVNAFFLRKKSRNMKILQSNIRGTNSTTVFPGAPSETSKQAAPSAFNLLGKLILLRLGS